MAKILFVDDSPDATDFALQFLILAGYDAKGAYGGQEAIDLFREAHESGRPFDLTVLDLAMPTVNGFMAADAIRKIDPEARFVFLTAYDEPTSAGRSETSGSLGMWSKPIRPSELVEKVRGVLEGESRT